MISCLLKGRSDITDNGPEIELEHERIRSFVAALCAEHGKPYNELRDEFVKALPEFMLDGTYKGEELLSTKRRGSYNVHALYKSERGRDLLFQRNYADTNGLLFLSDHMVGYLIESLYGRSGIWNGSRSTAYYYSFAVLYHSSSNKSR